MNSIIFFSLCTCSASTIKLVDQYDQQRMHFLSSVTVLQFRKTFVTWDTVAKQSTEMVPIILKLHNDWDKETLNDLIKLPITLFKVSGNRLHFSKVEEGCIAVTWLCPTADIKNLLIAIKESTDSLQTNKVCQVFVGEDLKWEYSQPKPAGDKINYSNSIVYMTCLKTSLNVTSLSESHIDHDNGPCMAREICLSVRVCVCMDKVQRNCISRSIAGQGNERIDSRFQDNCQISCNTISILLYRVSYRILFFGEGRTIAGQGFWGHSSPRR